MNDSERKKLIERFQNAIGDSEMDAKTTDELEELILRARFALKRRADNARKALVAVDEGA